ncbi:unnamed protein product [Meloidogyne enterolobii]|uniref:Uncharacterized protein n=1 Tax=Meloidogyne enterolobii TaxID=390850 RepID=A0ACB1AZJ2_MELEN
MPNSSKNFTNSHISNGKIDVIEMKRRSKPEENNIDCMASSSFKNVELTDDTENISMFHFLKGLLSREIFTRDGLSVIRGWAFGWFTQWIHFLKYFDNFHKSFKVNDQDNSDNDTTFVGNEFVELPPLTGRDPHGHSNVARPEPALVLLFQVLFPFIIAGLGMVFAGLVFDQVQHWSFYKVNFKSGLKNIFKEVPQALILVPALLGLKGNLEMTLASRLSTQSNIGKLDSLQEAYSIIIANIALIQAQAIVVTFLATASAMALSWIPRGQLDWEHATLLGASAVSTASFASLVLSLVMIAVIMTAKRWDINPDNVATPIAASLGIFIFLLYSFIYKN